MTTASTQMPRSPIWLPKFTRLEFPPHSTATDWAPTAGLWTQLRLAPRLQTPPQPMGTQSRPPRSFPQAGCCLITHGQINQGEDCLGDWRHSIRAASRSTLEQPGLEACHAAFDGSSGGGMCRVDHLFCRGQLPARWASAPGGDRGAGTCVGTVGRDGEALALADPDDPVGWPRSGRDICLAGPARSIESGRPVRS
jgi:hypothetical protein